jgi:hypothetical protein
MKIEFAVMKGTLERFVKLAAKDATEHRDGKKEVVAWFDPARAIGRQPTGRDHAMYMRVKFEFLTPGMQHAESRWPKTLACHSTSSLSVPCRSINRVFLLFQSSLPRVNAPSSTLSPPAVVCRAQLHNLAESPHLTFPPLNLHKARVRRKHGRPRSNGFIERAPSIVLAQTFCLKARLR